MSFAEWGRCFGGHDEHYSPLSVCQTNPLINYADTAKSEMVRSGMPTEQRTENPRVGGSIDSDRLWPILTLRAASLS